MQSIPAKAGIQNPESTIYIVTYPIMLLVYAAAFAVAEGLRIGFVSRRMRARGKVKGNGRGS